MGTGGFGSSAPQTGIITKLDDAPSSMKQQMK